MLSWKKKEMSKLVDLPKNKRAFYKGWVNQTKLKKNEEVDRCKARLVIKGYVQVHSIHFLETFRPVVKNDNNRYK